MIKHDLLTWMAPLLVAVLFFSSCSQAPQPSFEAVVPEGVAPLEVSFTNNSVNADQYLWSFGDGATSTEANPVHTYTGFGEMEVVLTATAGEQSVSDTMVIEIPEPPRQRVVIETAYGEILLELSNRTPLHRDNFIKLVKEGYYDGLLFHRVMDKFMIQGGDPDSRDAEPGQQLGMGGPGYRVPAEFDPELVHLQGALAAARDNNPEKASSGSQFYIVEGQPVNEGMLNQVETMRGFRYTPVQRAKYRELGGTPQLDREYTVFGYVLEGQEVVDQITSLGTDPYARPVEDVAMTIRLVEE
jgi:cyclophilin family peptidyl-prolyl cis-trans isomerase